MAGATDDDGGLGVLEELAADALSSVLGEDAQGIEVGSLGAGLGDVEAKVSISPGFVRRGRDLAEQALVNGIRRAEAPVEEVGVGLPGL